MLNKIGSSIEPCSTPKTISSDELYMVDFSTLFPVRKVTVH